MKNLLLLLALTLGMALNLSAQEVSSTEKAKNCVPTKECAKKMGMTTAECKKVCAKTCSGKKSTKVASASVSSDVVSETKAKKCCSSIEECAKKMGMTVEECKAKCSMLHQGESEAKVASASVASDVIEESAPAKKCCKGKKTCKK